MSNLAIIVPLYNPHNDWFDNICDSLAGLEQILNDIEYSVVLVNDGSSALDQSSVEKLLVMNKKVKFLTYSSNQGKGYAIRHGLNNTQADFYVYTDIDFPFGYNIIKDMYRIYMRSHLNLIIGIRNKEYFEMLPVKRRILSVTLHNLNYILTGFKVHDTQAGIKGFDNEAKKVFLATKTNGFLFDLEFIHVCLRKKLKYLSVDVHPRSNIMFSDFKAAVLTREFNNFIKILLRF